MKNTKYKIARVDRDGNIVSYLKDTYRVKKRAEDNCAQLKRLKNWFDLKVVLIKEEEII